MKKRFSYSILYKIFSFFEYLTILILGKILGISIVINYLRKPNPLISRKLLKSFGAKIGNNTTIKRTLFIDNVYEDADSKNDFSNIEIGNNCYIGDCVYFDLSNKIILENDICISANVSFVTHSDCNRSSFLNEKFPRQSKAIKVCAGAWIGVGSIILSGCTIAENSILSAKSLLKKDTTPKSIFAGIPAEEIKILQ